MSLRIALGLAAFCVACGCHTAPGPVTYQVEELGVVRDVLPRVVQPDVARWLKLKVGMTEAEVAGLLGQPYRKDPRPPDDTEPNVRHLYAWQYGEIAFESFTTKGTYAYEAVFHQGRVCEIRDPWNGKFSPDGRPTVPQLVAPGAGQSLDHYPRFMDFRWHPSSGLYPVEYEVAIQVLMVDQHEAEHFEDYIRKTVDYSRDAWRAQGMSAKEMDEQAASFARHLRKEQGVFEASLFRTHDLYLPFTWVGASTGRWRVRATNEQGTSEWTAWRYFRFLR
jgi:hypothetical protein